MLRNDIKMKVHIFTYELIDSKMYLILGNASAVVIDPNISEDAVELLKESNIRKVNIFLTHEHFDHISGVKWFRDRFDCTVYCSNACDRGMRSSIMNGSKHFNALFIDKEPEKLKEASAIRPMVCRGDVIFRGRKEMLWGEHSVTLVETPGHSPGSICILFDDEYIFTGDSLLKDVSVITRLPGGSRKEYEEKTVPFFKVLDKDVYVYPGHGESGYMSDFINEEALK